MRLRRACAEVPGRVPLASTNILMMDGFMGEKITLEQGVPQGDVLSPYIFNITVEFLLMKITHISSIEGIKFARMESRAETYADDTTIIIKRT